MFADYFSTYYLHLQYGTIFVTANYFIAVMLPVLFAGPLRRPRAWAKLAGLFCSAAPGGHPASVTHIFYTFCIISPVLLKTGDIFCQNGDTVCSVLPAVCSGV